MVKENRGNTCFTNIGEYFGNLVFQIYWTDEVIVLHPNKMKCDISFCLTIKFIFCKSCIFYEEFLTKSKKKKCLRCEFDVCFQPLYVLEDIGQ